MMLKEKIALHPHIAAPTIYEELIRVSQAASLFSASIIVSKGTSVAPANFLKHTSDIAATFLKDTSAVSTYIF